MHHFSNRNVLSVFGHDATSFLQRLITTDIENLSEKKVKPGALLSPQGKILVDFLIARKEEHYFFLDAPSYIADVLFQKLSLYRLRTNIEIQKHPEIYIYIIKGENTTIKRNDLAIFQDSRFNNHSIFRVYTQQKETFSNAISAKEWIKLRIHHGIAESPLDFIAGNVFPHDIGLHHYDGIKISKGCYVGQEVVSRMHHQAKLKKDIFLVTAHDCLPSSGGEIFYGSKLIGILGSVSGNQGLCLIKKEYIQNQQEAYTVNGQQVNITSPFRMIDHITQKLENI